MFIKQQLDDSRTDQQLIQHYQATNDLEVLSALYQRYLEIVYGVCLKYLRDPETSRDAVMDIFEILIRKVKSHQIDVFKSWLYVVVKNHCLQILRKNKRSLTQVDFDISVYSDDFLHHDISFDFAEDHQDLYECLKKLPDQQRSSIELFYLEKKSYSEVANILKLEKDQIRSNIQNGRRNLKICMLKKADRAK
ncbi:MAG: sigma-70 family RNA polymerase sigma factor [Saprospiraceae bacterium]|nr:sigma-70 family RNA polymerase sigma factor [Saprospiraceae bacterium]